VPLLKKYLWTPAMALVSPRRSANTLTVLGNACSAAAFGMLACMRPLGAPDTLFLVPSILLVAFLSIDNMDGMQARRTQRCTPFGEYLDHWGDTFNMGFSVLGFGLSMELDPRLVLLSLGLCQLTNFAQFWEQRLTGWLRFGHVGGTEGILLVSIFYAGVAGFGWDAFAGTPLVGPATGAHLFLLTACVGFVHAGLSCLWRVRRAPTAFTTLFLSVAVVAFWFLVGGLAHLPAALTLVLAGSLATGRQIGYRILERRFPTFDWPLLALLGLGAALGVWRAEAGLVAAIADWLPVTYLALRLSGDLIGMTRHLAEHLQPGELVRVVLLPRWRKRGVAGG
jgi:phosphatidylglycerophosphate synthase